jgi:O-antigen/teichoic acid export membrane protein
MTTSRSLFAEGSYSETELKMQLKNVIKIISIIIIPAIIVTSLFGNYVLLAFGKEYSYEGFILLKFLSISGIFISINAIGSVILNIKHRIKLLILLSLINTTVIFSLSVFFIKMNLFGVVGIGIG